MPCGDGCVGCRVQRRSGTSATFFPSIVCDPAPKQMETATTTGRTSRSCWLRSNYREHFAHNCPRTRTAAAPPTTTIAPIASKAVQQADALWSTPMSPDVSGRPPPNAYADLSADAVRKAARAHPTKQHAMAAPKEQVAAVQTTPDETEEAVQTWLAELTGKDDCNAEQASLCTKLGMRILQELHDSQLEPGTPCSQPLRWVLHGGPGAGKSHTLKMARKELFEQRLGWTHGIRFQVVSFQAVMAELLEGDTIHHALGLDWAGERNQNLLRTLQRARQTLQWRWLILDEFSVVSAELLAQLEHRCREIMRDLSLAKSFGGLNVNLCRRCSMGPAHREEKGEASATALHGQTLLWGGPTVGMQGLTELVRCERTGDAWLTEVQEQLRRGELSEDSHAFLHGNVTSVPGSWTLGRPACGTPACAALVGQSPDTIRRRERAVRRGPCVPAGSRRLLQTPQPSLPRMT